MVIGVAGESYMNNYFIITLKIGEQWSEGISESESISWSEDCATYVKEVRVKIGGRDYETKDNEQA